MKATSFHAGIHLDEADILPPETRCPLCSFEGFRSSTLKLQSNPNVFLLLCPRCQGLSSSRFPTELALRRYYSHYYKQRVFQGASNVTFHQPQRFASHLLRQVKESPWAEDVKILDFGGGDGDLALATARRLIDDGTAKVHVVLVDYNARSRETGSANISLECYEDLASVDAEAFDLVLASGILEHIPHPQPHFTRLLSSLQAGGLLYARTPYVAPLFRVLQYARLKLDFTYPAHLHDMGEAYWSNILRLIPFNSHEFELIRSQPSVVETTFRNEPARTLIAQALKFPWRLFRSYYKYVGGWEVIIRRASRREMTSTSTVDRGLVA